jgi:putative aminopeptidase FrvX
MKLTAAQRREHLARLQTVTNLLTAAGREDRVIRHVADWAKQRRGIELKADKTGNLLLTFKRTGTTKATGKPIVIVAHMDHPAFVIDEVHSPREVSACFRGGVRPAYFDDAKATFHTADDEPVHGRAIQINKPRQGKTVFAPFYRLRFQLSKSADLQVGDIGRWRMGPQRIARDLFHTPACDNLASVAAALCMLDVLLTTRGGRASDVRVLLTRAEEVGLIGSIAACKNKSVPKSSRVIVLETSRSMIESPIGAGPIVRVGDRLSTYNPDLTASIAHVAEQLALEDKKFTFQRKLMAGGSCEATVFCAYGYTASSICLPLGHYHNQGDLDAVEAGRNQKPAKADLEYISIGDFHKYVQLLAETAMHLGRAPSVKDRLAKVWAERNFVLKG